MPFKPAGSKSIRQAPDIHTDRPFGVFIPPNRVGRALIYTSKIVCSCPAFVFVSDAYLASRAASGLRDDTRCSRYLSSSDLRSMVRGFRYELRAPGPSDDETRMF